MTKKQLLMLLVMALIMVSAAIAIGRWSEQVNPDGIMPHPAPAGEQVEHSTNKSNELPRDAFSFGVSMGLLGSALLYFCVAAALSIQSRSQGKPMNRFIVSIGAMAALGFVLSYLIDDFFY